jgi:hypothetical protein
MRYPTAVDVCVVVHSFMPASSVVAAVAHALELLQAVQNLCLVSHLDV